MTAVRPASTWGGRSRRPDVSSVALLTGSATAVAVFGAAMLTVGATGVGEGRGFQFAAWSGLGLAGGAALVVAVWLLVLGHPMSSVGLSLVSSAWVLPRLSPWTSLPPRAQVVFMALLRLPWPGPRCWRAAGAGPADRPGWPGSPRAGDGRFDCSSSRLRPILRPRLPIRLHSVARSACRPNRRARGHRCRCRPDRRRRGSRSAWRCAAAAPASYGSAQPWRRSWWRRCHRPVWSSWNSDGPRSPPIVWRRSQLLPPQCRQRSRSPVRNSAASGPPGGRPTRDSGPAGPIRWRRGDIHFVVPAESRRVDTEGREITDDRVRAVRCLVQSRRAVDPPCAASVGTSGTPVGGGHAGGTARVGERPAARRRAGADWRTYAPRNAASWK